MWCGGGASRERLSWRVGRGWDGVGRGREGGRKEREGGREEGGKARVVDFWRKDWERADV